MIEWQIDDFELDWPRRKENGEALFTQEEIEVFSFLKNAGAYLFTGPAAGNQPFVFQVCDGNKKELAFHEGAEWELVFHNLYNGGWLEPISNASYRLSLEGRKAVNKLLLE